jgi:fatty-acyl-CoA synthase
LRQGEIDGLMASSMMVRPLLLANILDYAAIAFGYQMVVSCDDDGPLARMSFKSLRDRCLKVSGALGANFQVGPGERVATLAWTNRRHLELYFAIPGLGAVIHTINPRYSDEQIVMIINHARDRILFVDPDQEERVRRLAAQCPTVEEIRVLDASWDAVVDAAVPLPEWPQFPETSGSSMCYTSGTAGAPKGVIYSHRSTILYALSGLATGKLGLNSRASSLMCVPMYHVNGWSKPFQAMLSGAKIVLPGRKMDGESLLKKIDAEDVTCGFGVPTIWLAVVEAMRKQGRGPGTLSQIGFGGGAVPRSLLAALRDEFGVEVETGYGMTETTAGLALGSDGPDFWAADSDDQLDLLSRQRPIFGIELRSRDEAGRDVPVDGASSGELQVRGNFVINAYFDNAEADAAAFTPDGWFRTGDAVSQDEMGRLRVEDRLKDLIKSGGEWINSVALEQAACGDARVAEAAVIGLPHPKWSERPLMIIRPTDALTVDEASIADFLRGRVQSWWQPDAIVFVDDIPKTATGKTDKKALRLMFAGWHYGECGTLCRSE